MPQNNKETFGNIQVRCISSCQTNLFTKTQLIVLVIVLFFLQKEKWTNNSEPADLFTYKLKTNPMVHVYKRLWMLMSWGLEVLPPPAWAPVPQSNLKFAGNDQDFLKNTASSETLQTSGNITKRALKHGGGRVMIWGWQTGGFDHRTACLISTNGESWWDEKRWGVLLLRGGALTL